MTPKPTDPELYEVVKKRVYAMYKTHSAYRSGQLVKAYKLAFKKKYKGTNKEPYIGKKTKAQGLQRWFAEEWLNQRGEVGYKFSSDIYRPTKRITKKTPITHSELTISEKKRAQREKRTTGRVKKFKI